MQDIIIVCAGNYAREIHSVIMRSNRIADEEHVERPYNLLGFIDDHPDALDGTGIEEPILGSIVDWHPKGNERYAMGTGNPTGKVKLANMLKARGCIFVPIIAPTAIIPSDLVMGEGCVIEAYRIGYGVVLGDFVNVNGSMLMSGARIDDFSTTTGFAVVENASVGKRVYIGSHAVITDGITIGDDVKVSVGSIVTKDVSSGMTVFGVPAETVGW